MNILKPLIAMALILCASAGARAAQPDTINLAGLWRFQPDQMGFGMTPGSELYLSRLSESIMLPGSTDTGSKGVRNSASYIDRLSRKHEYLGQAWYQREVTIPDRWKDRNITLDLERCHWITTLYVDGKKIGTGERLSTPHRWNLSKELTPGIHVITVCVDNRAPYPMDQWAHGITEYTQTNWNGITGKMTLTARPESHITDMAFYPDVDSHSVKIISSANITAPSRLSIEITGPDGNKVAAKAIEAAAGDSVLTTVINLGKNVRLWDEFDPALYTVSATLDSDAGSDTRSGRFGMREVTRGKHHIRINGIDRHLRGTLDCAVWPLTGYPSTDKADWLRQFSIIKDYGMNHVRFHSWCPPKAAFDAADELGIYLQVELPMWIKDVGRYPARRDWFEREMHAVLREYGNHPSFIL